MKVVILAAGVGTRLMPLTRNTPKSLLDLGSGFSLLERQLQSIAKCGLHDVILVTGYKSAQIEAKVEDYTDFSLQVVFNPFYRISNNLPSAWLGLKDLREPVVLVNGDDLFKSQVLNDLIRSTAPVTMVISRKESYDQDDMKVIIDGKLIKDVGKEISVERADGESIGMILFNDHGLKSFKNYLLQMLRDEQNLHVFYLSALRRMMHDGFPIAFSECAPGDWAEVDFHPDLQEMRRDILADLPSWD